MDVLLLELGRKPAEEAVVPDADLEFGTGVVFALPVAEHDRIKEGQSAGVVAGGATILLP